MRIVFLGALLFAAATLVACGGSSRSGVQPAAVPSAASATAATAGSSAAHPAGPGGASPPTAEAGASPARGAIPQPAARQRPLLVTRNDGLYARDLATGRERRLIATSGEQFATFPAWSADGLRFAYVLGLPFRTTGDWGDDLYVADADGKNVKQVYRHDATGARLESPTWTPTGSALLFGYSLLSFDRGGTLLGQRYEVRRLDLQANRVTTVLGHAGEPQLCLDGSHFAYIGFDDATNTWNSVGFAAVDGNGARVLVDGSQGLLTFYAPHPSPGCDSVVFAAVGPGPGGLPATARQRSAAGPPTLLSGPRFGVRDGSPWDLWLVRTDGNGLTQLTHIGEDQPYPVWANDGSSILFIGTNGVYQMLPDGGGLHTLGTGAMHGQISA